MVLIIHSSWYDLRVHNFSIEFMFTVLGLLTICELNT